MKLINQSLFALLAGTLACTACAEDGTEDTAKYENQALQAWMTQYRSELLDNFQPAGTSGYYVELLDKGNMEAAPIGDDDVWVKFNVSARDLTGNLLLTRNAAEAKLLNTFTKYTRYVPYYRYCGAENAGLMEGTWLAMRNPLTVKGESQPVRLREGSKVNLYLPSLLIGTVSESGGYEGETTLAENRPMILQLEIVDTVKNPLQTEGVEVDRFCTENGGLLRYFKPSSMEMGGSMEGGVLQPTSADDPNHPYKTAARWTSVCDSVAQLYANFRYDPSLYTTEAGDGWNFPQRYDNGFAPYNDPELDRKIAEALVKRFHTETPYAGAVNLKSDSVGMDGTAKIWYIGRFLDGFIFDTNIDEVKELIYDADYTKGSALSYTPKQNDMIQAFYYTVPNMRYGQWTSLITVSTNGYGASGKSGTTTTQSSNSSSASTMAYLNYLSYMNSYYNGYYGGYYGGYYDNYYGGYYGNYYDNYYSSATDTETTTTTTVSTEIPSYTPLIFQIYIEPKK